MIYSVSRIDVTILQGPLSNWLRVALLAKHSRAVIDWERAEVVYDPGKGVYTLTDEGVEVVVVEPGNWRDYFERKFRLRNKPPMEVLEMVLGLPVKPGLPVTLKDLREMFGGGEELPRVLFDGEGGFRT